MYVDPYRYPPKPPPRLPLPDRSQWRDILAGYNAFEDGESRAWFRALLTYRYVSKRLSAVTHNREMFDALNAFMTAERSSEPIPNAPVVVNEPLALWRAEYNGAPVEIVQTHYGLYWTAVCCQYYFGRGDVYVGPSPGDIVLDCGACLGDTAVKLAAHVGPTGHIYSFDQLAQHVTIARDVAARNGMAAMINTYCCGIASKTRPNIDVALSDPQPSHSPGINPGKALDEGDTAISIDDFCRAKGLKRIDYIKMDIEGSEADALAGAHETILRFRPKLAICLYHKPADLWSIPLSIKQRYPFYRLYLDHHTLHNQETVMYARAA